MKLLLEMQPAKFAQILLELMHKERPVLHHNVVTEQF